MLIIRLTIRQAIGYRPRRGYCAVGLASVYKSLSIRQAITHPTGISLTNRRRKMKSKSTKIGLRTLFLTVAALLLSSGAYAQEYCNNNQTGTHGGYYYNTLGRKPRKRAE